MSSTEFGHGLVKAEPGYQFSVLTECSALLQTQVGRDERPRMAECARLIRVLLNRTKDRKIIVCTHTHTHTHTLPARRAGQAAKLHSEMKSGESFTERPRQIRQFQCC